MNDTWVAVVDDNHEEHFGEKYEDDDAEDDDGREDKIRGCHMVHLGHT
jgi:hypothetical protein